MLRLGENPAVSPYPDGTQYINRHILPLMVSRAGEGTKRRASEKFQPAQGTAVVRVRHRRRRSGSGRLGRVATPHRNGGRAQDGTAPRPGPGRRHPAQRQAERQRGHAPGRRQAQRGAAVGATALRRRRVCGRLRRRLRLAGPPRRQARGHERARHQRRRRPADL
ncbi:hypothetical protein G6F65_020596 [Rhizopus arrhizus]|nr:hypothetical protein G6F65_020596 [Rhizopus arrhizus]